MERLKGKKLILGTLLIAFLVFFVMPPQVHAQLGFITDIAGGVIAKFAFLISYVIALILGAFMSLAAYLASIALNLNYFVISKSNSLVGIGWSIVRDVANLGFVIVIIVMAFATIVRFEKYGYQKILPKLIAAAILINFSLSIAGVFVDFANILTHFFFDRISQDPVEIAGTIAGAFNPQRLFTQTPDLNQIKPGASLTDSLFLLVAQPVFTAVFLLVATFTILVFAFLLLLRFLHLTFLLIIAPIVWLFWVIPELSGKFKNWWSDFFKWLFFAPAASFFMYLALRALEESPGFWGPTQGNQLIAGLSGLENIFIQGAQMVVLVGIMLGGLIISQKMGIEAADAAVNWAGKMKGKAQGWATTKAKGWGERAVTAGVDTEGRTALERFGVKYGKVPLIGRAITGLSGVSAKAKASLAKGVEAQVEKAKTRTWEDNANILNRATAVMPLEEVAGRAIAVAEKGKWNELSGEAQVRAVKALQQTKAGERIVAFKPDLAPQFGKTVEWGLEKVEDSSKLTNDIIEQYAHRLSTQQIAQLGYKGSVAQREALAKGVTREMGGQNLDRVRVSRQATDKLTLEIDKKTEQVQNLNVRIRTEPDVNVKNALKQQVNQVARERQTLTNNRNTARTELTKLIDSLGREAKRALESYDAASKNPNYQDVDAFKKII